MAVPFLAVAAIVLGQRSLGSWLPGAIRGADPQARSEYELSCRRWHRKVVRFAFPIWLYVSVTGVIVYLMLYHLWPSAEIGG
jgi:uncharacterized membrane protein YozB (DUF420 family)